MVEVPAGTRKPPLETAKYVRMGGPTSEPDTDLIPCFHRSVSSFWQNQPAEPDGMILNFAKTP